METVSGPGFRGVSAENSDERDATRRRLRTPPAAICALILALGAMGACRRSPGNTAAAAESVVERDQAAREKATAAVAGIRWIDMLRTGPDGRVPPLGLEKARRERERLLPASKEGALRAQSVSGDAWKPMGPHPLNNVLYAPVSGRVRAVAIDESDPIRATFYVGGATGGVWKTVNGGMSWTPLSDAEESVAIGAIAIDPQDSSIIYVGTGEYGGGYEGAGILRSTDGGSTWTRLGAAEFTGGRIARIALDPTPTVNPAKNRIVYLAGNLGLFRSADAGATWEKVWFDEPYADFSDVVVVPGHPQTVFAARRSTNPDVETPPVYISTHFGAWGSWHPATLPGDGLPHLGYRRVSLAISDTLPPVLIVGMEDARNGRDFKGAWITSNYGSSWTRVNGHPPEFAEHSFEADPDRMEAEPNDSIESAQWLWPGAVVQGALSSGTDRDFYGVYVQGNELSFEICADRAGHGFDPRIRLYDSSGDELPFSPIDNGLQHSGDERLSTAWTTFPAGNYFLAVESSDGTLTGDGAYQLSVNGSSLWCQCDYDQVVAVDPSNTSTMYWGGIRLFRTTDSGSNWCQIQDHEAPGQGSNWIHQDIQTVAIDSANPSFQLWGTDGGVWATTDGGNNWVDLNTNLELTQFYHGISQHPSNPDFMLAGSQDNATARFTGTGWIWPAGPTGDGGSTAIDFSDPTQRSWFFLANGVPHRTRDDGATAPEVTNGLGLDAIGPLVIDPNDAGNLLFGGGVKVSGNLEHKVFRTTNSGDDWAAISPDLGSNITALAIAPSDSSWYYAGTVDGWVWSSRDGGGTWINWTSAPLPSGPVTDIAVDPNDRAVVCISTGSFGVNHIFRSSDGGSSWTSISSAPYSAATLPAAPFLAVAVDPAYPDTIFAAGDVGIFRTTDLGVHWETFDEGLPKVPVTDLELNPASNTLRAATYGRGMWELTVGNDDCMDAHTLQDGTLTATTTGASNDGATDCGSSDASPDVWYAYTATATGELAIDTCGSSFDTVLSVHSVGCPAGVSTELACNDDCVDPPTGCGVRDSCLVLPVSQGQGYLIRVSGYNGASGDFVLTVDNHLPPPANDDCGSFILSNSGSYTGWTSQAGSDGTASCGSSDTSPDVWYRYIAQCTGTLEAFLCNTNFDTVLSAHSDCPGSIEGELACNDDWAVGSCAATDSFISVPVIKDSDTYLRVSGYNGASGEFELTIACRPGNDNWDHPKRIRAGSTPFDTTEATTDGPDGDPLCDNAGDANLGQDLWFSYAPECDARIEVDTCDADFDTKIAVYDGGACPTSPSSIACNDDACGSPLGRQSKVVFEGLGGQHFLIRVGGFRDQVGAGTLNLTETCLSTIVFIDDFETGDTSAWSIVVP